MSDDFQPIPRFKALLKDGFDVHLPVNITDLIQCAPGDYITLEVIPSQAVQEKPYTTSHEMETKQRLAEANEIGANTFNYYLPLWLQNVRDWLFLMKEAPIKTTDQVPVPNQPGPAMVFGAGPSLYETKPEEWELLKKFSGTLVATNKALVPLLEHGIVPQWVVALDGEEVVYKSFDSDTVRAHKGEINFLGPTVLNHKVVEFVRGWAKECYWGNSHMPSGHDVETWNVNVILEALNGLPVLRHGGNVGTMGWLLAKKLKCNPIGMYGFNLCFNPDKTWTREKAVDYEYIFNPENQEVLAFDSPFRAYVSILIEATDMAWNESLPFRTVNLTPRGALFLSGFFPNFTLKEFVEEPRETIISRADEDRAKAMKRVTDKIKEIQEGMKPIFKSDEF